MLFGFVGLLLVVLVLFDATAYWHARNVLADAAAEGVRIAAAFDGSCAEGEAVARAQLERQAGGWADDVEVRCSEGATVTLTLRSRTPGAAARGVGLAATVTQTAPRER